MKVLVAGATGALGKQLVPRLVADGHEVVGITRSEAKLGHPELGATGVVADVLDPEQVARVVAEAEPEVIIHQLTALNRRLRRSALRPHVRGDEPAPHGGHGPSARGRPRGRREAVHRPELRGLAVRPDRRTGEDRGRPARPHAPGGDAGSRSMRSATSSTP